MELAHWREACRRWHLDVIERQPIKLALIECNILIESAYVIVIDWHAFHVQKRIVTFFKFNQNLNFYFYVILHGEKTARR